LDLVAQDGSHPESYAEDAMNSDEREQISRRIEFRRVSFWREAPILEAFHLRYQALRNG
jgi:hypothetical protein